MIKIRKDISIVKKKPKKKSKKKTVSIPLVNWGNKNYIKVASIKELFREASIQEKDKTYYKNLFKMLISHVSEEIELDIGKEVTCLNKNNYVYVCVEHNNGNRRNFKALQKISTFWKNWLTQEFNLYNNSKEEE